MISDYGLKFNIKEAGDKVREERKEGKRENESKGKKGKMKIKGEKESKEKRR